jgi:hypothetical protein
LVGFTALVGQTGELFFGVVVVFNTVAVGLDAALNLV